MKSFKFLSLFISIIILGITSCSKQEFDIQQDDKYGDLEASIKRQEILANIDKLNLDPLRRATLVRELNQDQTQIRKRIVSDLIKEGINPDDILLMSIDDILSNAGEHKPSTQKASIAECARAQASYIKQLGYSFSVLSTYDLALLHQLNFQVSGSYNFASLDQYINVAGLTHSQAISITGISWPNDIFYFRSHDGNIVIDAILGNCF